MCGIAGIVERDRSRRPDEGALRRMVEVLHHRGPDSGGMVAVGPAGLGMRRLAVIDPAGGGQPMSDEAGEAWVVYNGEIYNFRELARDLEAGGVHLRTRSDTEVLLRLFQRHGPDCVRFLNGMFAFAAYDRRRNLLLLARDRLGIKPLYYRLDPDRLRFGSEVKAILADPRVPREIDPQAVHDFLAFNYMPAPQTALKGVRQLEPGHRLVLENGRERIERYWELRYEPERTRPEEYWVGAVRDSLEASVKRRLVSDVPFGAFLSGGIDSSAVVAFMSRHLDRPVKTFSIGFREPSYSELDQAGIAARAFGTEHHELVVEPDVADLVPRLVWHSDEPSGDSSAIPVYLVSELARRHVTMALSGDGGDELFAGYETYQAHHWRRAYRRIPRLVRSGLLRPLVESLPPSSRKSSLESKAKRFVRGAELSSERSHYSWRNIMDDALRADLYAPGFAAGFTPLDSFRFYREHFDRSRGWDPLDRMLHVDTGFYLPNDMLVKVDRMSMACSLEVRVPYLDHTLVELAARIPPEIKFKGREKKALLKRALRGMVPDVLLDQPKKGFNVPIPIWLRGPLAPLARETLGPERQRRMGLFRPEAVTRLLEEHLSGRRDHSFPLWGLLTLSLWHEIFLEGGERRFQSPPAEPARTVEAPV